MFKKKIDLNMINATSKMGLKASCLRSCHGDISQAKELYDFLADGIESLPDFEPEKPSIVKQAGQAAGNIFGWLRENQNEISQVWGFVQTLRGNAPAAPVPPVEIPPIP